MAELIAIREYARRVGKTDTSVHKAIKAGKIVKGVVVDKDGKKKIDPDVATAEWDLHKDPSYQRTYKSGKSNTEEIDAPVVSIPSGNAPAQSPGTKKSLADIKRDTAEVKLHISALELKEKKGQLVDKEKVYKALFAAGQEVRTTFQSIPDRVIDEILSAPTRNDAHAILFNAIADGLEQLSEVVNREIVIR